MRADILRVILFPRKSVRELLADAEKGLRHVGITDEMKIAACLGKFRGIIFREREKNNWVL